MKRITILGSTGSIGTQTLDVVRKNRDKFEVVAISANSSVDLLLEQILEFSPKYVTVYNEESAKKLKDMIPDNINIEVLTSMEGLVKICELDEVDVVLTAVVGMIGLVPTMAAIKAKKTIALANKETLVTAGELVMSEAKKNNVKILPVDSEHSAIFQCLNGERHKDIEKIILTASGGPFRGKKREELINTKNEALKHPNWDMGRKISIDSSTLMNKGLEVIEAKWLFDVDVEDIDVVVHPQSIIHSMVSFKDSSVISQMGCPDMRLPIVYALTYPERIETDYERLDLAKVATLTFEKPDMDTFKGLKLAYTASDKGGNIPTAFNAANELAVAKFLDRKIKYLDIPDIIEYAMNEVRYIDNPSVDEILETEQTVYEMIENRLKNGGAEWL